MKGDTDAMTRAGYGMLCDSLSQESSDIGMQWLNKAAEKGNQKAAALIGYVMQFDHCGQYNLENCKRILEEESNKGNPFAQWFLGDMLFHGREPFNEDKISGMYYIKQAAEQGNNDALSFLQLHEKKPTVREIYKMILLSWFK